MSMELAEAATKAKRKRDVKLIQPTVMAATLKQASDVVTKATKDGDKPNELSIMRLQYFFLRKKGYSKAQYVKTKGFDPENSKSDRKLLGNIHDGAVVNFKMNCIKRGGYTGNDAELVIGHKIEDGVITLTEGKTAWIKRIQETLKAHPKALDLFAQVFTVKDSVELQLEDFSMFS